MVKLHKIVLYVHGINDKAEWSAHDIIEQLNYTDDLSLRCWETYTGDAGEWNDEHILNSSECTEEDCKKFLDPKLNSLIIKRDTASKELIAYKKEIGLE